MGDRVFSPDTTVSSDVGRYGSNQAWMDDHFQPLDLSMKRSGMHRSEVRVCSGTITEILGQAMGRVNSGASTQHKLSPTTWSANPVLQSPSIKTSNDSITMRKTNEGYLQHVIRFSPDLNVSGRTDPVSLLPQTQSFSPNLMFQEDNVSISEAEFDPHVALLNMVLAKYLSNNRENSPQGNPQNSLSQIIGKANVNGLHHQINIFPHLKASGKTNPMLLSQTQSSSPISETGTDPHVTLPNMVLAQHLPSDRDNPLHGYHQNHPLQMTPPKSCFENQAFLGQNYQHDLSQMLMNNPSSIPFNNPIISEGYNGPGSIHFNLNLFRETIARIYSLGFDAFFENDQQFLRFRKIEIEVINRRCPFRQTVIGKDSSVTRNCRKRGNSESCQDSDENGGDIRRDSCGQPRDSYYWKIHERKKKTDRKSRLAKRAKEIDTEIQLKYIKMLVDYAYLFQMFLGSWHKQ
ncbi:uncharacterized protein [Palaemon carinicauda]|uniref:uncharacterized protein n=1 Tax=Palaemon carinicauda TaxID=392227 RepID=UPI0035B5C5C5